MIESLIVKGAPEEYICEVGAWSRLEEHLTRRKINRVLVSHGEKSFEVAKHFLPTFKSVEAIFKHYKNECRYEIAKEFVEWSKKNDIEGIVAIGGGKALDLDKLVAECLSIKCVFTNFSFNMCSLHTC